jgi:hypothetical protein
MAAPPSVCPTSSAVSAATATERAASISAGGMPSCWMMPLSPDPVKPNVWTRIVTVAV